MSSDLSNSEMLNNSASIGSNSSSLNESLRMVSSKLIKAVSNVDALKLNNLYQVNEVGGSADQQVISNPSSRTKDRDSAFFFDLDEESMTNTTIADIL